MVSTIEEVDAVLNHVNGHCGVSTSISPEEEENWGVIEGVFSYTLTGFQPPRMVKPVSPDLMPYPDGHRCHKVVMK